MTNNDNLASSAPAPPVKKTSLVRSTLVSRNVTVARKRTSIRLEPEMWDGLQEVCRRERATLHQICTSVAVQKPEDTSLTAAIRVFVMRYYRMAATEEGHSKAGHGFGLTLALDSGTSSPYTRPMPIRLHKNSFA